MRSATRELATTGLTRNSPLRNHLGRAEGMLVPIDNCDRVESFSALPRRWPGAAP
jgi:hypothetical protein